MQLSFEQSERVRKAFGTFKNAYEDAALGYLPMKEKK